MRARARVGLLGSLVVMVFGTIVQAQHPLRPPTPRPREEPTVTWQDLLPFFEPPDEFKGKLGAYRSAMTFDSPASDGVKSPADWPRRRAEIAEYWHSAMGKWPALVAKPGIELAAKEHVESFTRRQVRVEVAAGVMQKAWLLVPDGKGPFPAQLVVFYDAESGAGLNPARRSQVDWGYQFAKRGFVTLSLGWTPAGPKTIQPLSWLAYTAANCNTVLAGLPEVDPTRIGVIGHSFGGKWAMFASCLDERFAAAVWCDPGIVWNERDPNANYWEPWYLGFDASLGKQREEGVVSADRPRTGAYKRLLEEGHDMNELHALMAPRPFLVSGGAQDSLDHWPALNHAIALYKFLGLENRVGMTIRDGHTPTPLSNAQVVAFFEHFLKGETGKGR